MAKNKTDMRSRGSYHPSTEITPKEAAQIILASSVRKPAVDQLIRKVFKIDEPQKDS
jgi:outer membrane lipopolysaccharide assembly protein LptE/RlpB